MTARHFIGVVVIALSPSLATAQQHFEIDLARPSETTITLTGSPGNIRVLVVNQIPGAPYSYSVEREVMLPEPFPIPSFLTTGKETGAVCDTLKMNLIKLADAKEETTVAEILPIVVAADATNCTQALRDERDRFVRQTKYTITALLEPGTLLRFRVTRPLEGGKVKTWTLIVTGPSRGSWQATYGFAIVPDRDELFFSKAAGDKKFVITPKADVKALTPIPAVFYTWLPASRAGRNFAVSPVGGLGITDDKVSVFLGGDLSFNVNLHINAGVALYPQKRLDGRYEVGQEVAENLAEDQLQRTVFNAGWFVAVGFRFGEWPFGSSKDKSKPGAQAAGEQGATEAPAKPGDTGGNAPKKKE